MAILEVLHYPDDRLRAKAKPVAQVDGKIRKIVADMFETMYASNGIGLAAIQVNIPHRIIVMDISDNRGQPLCLINPEITAKSGEQKFSEGCLSVPGVFEDLTVRADQIQVQCLDEHGQAREINANGLLSVCIQHEMDHLEGKLFVDYLSPLKRQRIRSKMEKARRRTL
jgi:peptide deformylase